MRNDNFREYEPAFPGELWTNEERILLHPFASNLNGLVTVLHNLPPEIVGALCSRASRASGSLVRVLHDEYLKPILDGDPELAKELRTIIEFLQTRGFKNILNNQRAQAFYAKWLSQYGDDSIAQMTGTHVAFWGISQVAMKYIEDQRIGLEPIEKSTRYVNFGNKIGGNYLYYTPRPDLERMGLLADYKKTLDGLFETYIALVAELKAWLKTNYEEKESVLEKKAFDTLRGLLPMATLGQVALRGNAQAFEYLINRTAAHELGEFRWIARALKEELDKEIPSLLLRVGDEKSEHYQDYLARRKTAVRELIKKTAPALLVDSPPSARPIVELAEYDPDGEQKILAGIVFASSTASWKGCIAAVKRMSEKEKDETLKSYLDGRRERWQKVGRAFENSYVRFDILMDIGAYRDLHRHRMMTQERQFFTIRHGYDIPSEINAAGIERKYRTALDSVIPLFTRLETHSPELAQYVVPLAYRVRFYQYENLRQFFWEAELRTGPQGHPNYRAIEQEKYRLLKEKLPRLARFMLVDMSDYDFARRGTEEAIKEKEDRLKRQLKERG